MQFEVSFFANKYDTVPKPGVWSWEELCDIFRLPQVRSEKDGKLFSPAIFRGSRAKVNVERLSLLVFDLDHDADLEAIEGQLSGLGCSYVLYSTHSHLRITDSNAKAEPRFRVVIPLAESIPATEFPSLWRHIQRKTKLPIDEAAKDTSRMFYIPAIATPEAVFHFYSHPGEPLDWVSLGLPANLPKDSEPRQPHGMTAKDFKKGRRNPELFKLAKKLFNEGLGLESVLLALLEINSLRCKPPLENDEVVSIVQNAKIYPIEAASVSPFTFDAMNVKPLSVIRLSEVESKTVDWLWDPLIPTGFFTLCDGVEGIGKTYLMLKVGAMTAAGETFPGCSKPTTKGEVLLLSAEDSAAYTLKPRLERMGAECDDIFALDCPFTLDNHGFRQLELLLCQHSFKFVLIDPLFSFTGKVNLNADSEIRSVTDRLNRLAEDFGCAIVGVRHIGKTKGYGDPRNAGLNGVGWRAGARSHLIVGQSPEDKAMRAIAQTKTNLTSEASKSYGYLINQDGDFLWTGESGLTVETMLSYKQSESVEERGAKKVAKEFLADQLEEGRVGSVAILESAKQAGIATATLYRAKSEMRIESKKDPSFTGGWSWALPVEESTFTAKVIIEGSHANGHDNLGANDANKALLSNNLAEAYQPFKSDDLGDILGTAMGKEYRLCICGKHVFAGQQCPFCERLDAGSRFTEIQ